MIKIFAVSLVGFTEVLLVTYLFHSTAVTTVSLAVASLCLVWLVGFKKHVLLTFVSSAIGGFFAEAIVVSNGAWTYHSQHLFGLPIWLLFLWGSAGVAIGFLMRELELACNN